MVYGIIEHGSALFHFPIFASITEIVINNNAIFAEFNRKIVLRDHFVLGHIPDIFYTVNLSTKYQGFCYLCSIEAATTACIQKVDIRTTDHVETLCSRYLLAGIIQTRTNI